MALRGSFLQKSPGSVIITPDAFSTQVQLGQVCFGVRIAEGGGVLIELDRVAIVSLLLQFPRDVSFAAGLELPHSSRFATILFLIRLLTGTIFVQRTHFALARGNDEMILVTVSEPGALGPRRFVGFRLMLSQEPSDERNNNQRRDRS